MKRLLKFLTVFLLLLSAGYYFTSKTQAVFPTSTPPTTQVLFTDSFTGTDGTELSQYNSNWVARIPGLDNSYITNNELVGVGNNSAYIYSPLNNLTNVCVSVDFHSEWGYASWVSLETRYTNNGGEHSYIGSIDNKSSYSMGKDYSAIKSGTIPTGDLDTGLHNLVFCSVGTTHALYLDNSLLDSFTDNSYSDGYVVFDTGPNMYIDNFRIGEYQPAITTLNPTGDNYIKQGSQNENEGNSTFMRLQSSGHNRGLVKFDESQIEAAVGSSSSYTAKLRLTITDNGNNWGNTGRDIELHRLTSDWVEGNGFIDGNSPSNRGTGTGATWNCSADTNISNTSANCNGATQWNMDNSSQWPFVSNPSATQTIHNNQTGVVEFDVTQDIQAFINGTQNDGWLIKKVDEGQNGRVQFGTKESSYSPELVITAY